MDLLRIGVFESGLFEDVKQTPVSRGNFFALFSRPARARRYLSVVLVGKLAWEQWQGALPLSGDMPVVVDAHLYGAIGGALAGAWLAVHNRAPFRTNR